MNKENKYLSYIVATVFCCILFVGFIKNNALATIEDIFEYLGQTHYDLDYSLSLDKLKLEYANNIYKHRELVDFNGLMSKILNMKGLYGDTGMYVTNDGYIISVSDATTTDYEFLEIVEFKDFLDRNEINLLYVNEPTKYIADSVISDEFGIESFSNRNMDLFLSRIRSNNINAIDLRESIKEEHIDVHDLFYRTDHHWTVPAGLWATQRIAKGLNDYCGYNIDTKIYDIENYESVTWKNCWLGEQGRKLAKTYTGLDDFTELKPVFETNFTFKENDGTTWKGTFEDFIDESCYNTENDVYENGSWHYSYDRINCINNNIEKGKVLVVGDSFNHVVHPFLALGVHELDSLILRAYDDSFSLRDYILENNYDTIIIAYAQFMVGAHDYTSSSNYRMFTFE